MKTRKWIPHRHDGDTTPIDAQRFAHYIGTIAHDFAVHQSLDAPGYAVSHWDSGRRVAYIPDVTLSCCSGNAVDAARIVLSQLVTRFGESRVHLVLASAPAREKISPKAVACATI